MQRLSITQTTSPAPQKIWMAWKRWLIILRRIIMLSDKHRFQNLWNPLKLIREAKIHIGINISNPINTRVCIKNPLLTRVRVQQYSALVLDWQTAANSSFQGVQRKELMLGRLNFELDLDNKTENHRTKSSQCSISEEWARPCRRNLWSNSVTKCSAITKSYKQWSPSQFRS